MDGADTRVDEPIEYAPFSGALGGFWRWRRSMTVRRTEAAKIGGVGLHYQIIPDWMLRFNARGPDAFVNGKSPGQPSKLNDAQRQAIAEMIERGPIPAIHGVARWRLIDLAQWIFEEFRIKSPNRR